MINIIGTEEIIRNIAVISSMKMKKFEFKNISELEFKFHEFLYNYQPKVPRINNYGTNIIKKNHIDIEDKLTKIFLEEALLNDRVQGSTIGNTLDEETHKIREDSVLKSLDIIKTKIPNIYFLIQIIIDSIFLRYSDSSGGGSTSAAIGVIWINARLHWSEQDIIELLVHELTHNLIFIDEIRYTHFKDYNLLVNPSNFSNSAIIGIKRPIDKVFHSIVVSTEIILLRKKYLGELKKYCVHPSSEKFLIKTKEAIDSLMKMKNYKSLLTERGQFIIEKCFYKINDLLLIDKRISA